jgi:hypothetical protein
LHGGSDGVARYEFEISYEWRLLAEVAELSTIDVVRHASAGIRILTAFDPHDPLEPIVSEDRTLLTSGLIDVHGAGSLSFRFALPPERFVEFDIAFEAFGSTSVAAIPEPSSVVLLGIGGLLLIAGYTWRGRLGGSPKPSTSA